MAGDKKVPQKKLDLCERLRGLFQKYNRLLLVTSENVNATQLLHIRHDLMNDCEMVFGKNSLMRRTIDELTATKPELAALKEELYNGVGLCFTNGPFVRVKEVIDANCVGSPAKVGAISPVDVTIPPMRTTMSPTQVSVLHALNIQSKIFKGTIEITSEKLLIKQGEKVGASEANLLGILGIQPFKYTLKIEKIYDNGKIWSPDILAISDNVLGAKFAAALRSVAGLSVGIGYVNQASAPHLVGAAFRNVAAIAVALDIPVKQIADIQALLSDPEAVAKLKAQAEAAAAAAPAGGGAAAAAEPAKKEEEAVVELAGGFDDLFG
jgi:large subunit ribosomal protein LP0